MPTNFHIIKRKTKKKQRSSLINKYIKNNEKDTVLTVWKRHTTILSYHQNNVHKNASTRKTPSRVQVLCCHILFDGIKCDMLKLFGFRFENMQNHFKIANRLLDFRHAHTNTLIYSHWCLHAFAQQMLTIKLALFVCYFMF